MKQRTWAIYVLFILAIIAGIMALLDAARYMGWLPIASLGRNEIRAAQRRLARRPACPPLSA